MSDPIPMELVGIRIEVPSHTPILLLKEMTGDRYLPIWIGASEATAIAVAKDGIEPQRPMTHDLLKTVVEVLGASVDRVVVTDLDSGTFYADLVLVRDDEELTISSRPSDAIALATRLDTPVFASASVLDEAGVELRDAGQEEEIERFREFLDDINPEDFGATQ